MSKLVIALLSTTLIGCDTPKNITPEEAKAHAAREVSITKYNIPGADVLEFRLQDGTRCVTKYGAQNSVTCDWRK